MGRMVLYMIYFPPHLKYVSAIALDSNESGHSPPKPKAAVKSDTWRLSIILSWVVALSMSVTPSFVMLCLTLLGRLFTGFVSFLLLGMDKTPSPDETDPQRGAQIELWAIFLGVASSLLAAMQYAPQIVHTYRLKVVGALSISMMLLQSPGSLLMVISIAMRPGTNWTSKHASIQLHRKQTPTTFLLQLGFRTPLRAVCSPFSSSCASSGCAANADLISTTLGTPCPLSQTHL